MIHFQLDMKEWDVSLKGAISSLVNTKSLLERAFLAVGLKDLKDHFDREEGPDGKWAPRKQSTNDAYDRIYSGLRKNRALKRTYGSLEGALAGGERPLKTHIGGIPRSAFRSSNKLLQLTGYLRQRSVLQPRLDMVGADTLRVMSMVDYSGVHDEGSKSRNIPQRQFMYLSEQGEELMLKAILEGIAL